MIRVYRAADVRAADERAIASGTSIETLMERAGWAVAREALRMMNGGYGKRVVVLCGKGNNAGDGLVAAGILQRRGAGVTVACVLGDAFTGAAGRARAAWSGETIDRPSRETLATLISRCDLVVDAIFGVGYEPRDDVQPLLDVTWALRTANLGRLRSERPKVLSVDVPSGLDADTGLGIPVIEASRTVTFGGYKPGLLFGPGAAGRVVVADIGTSTIPTAFAMTPGYAGLLLGSRAPGDHKRSAGRLLIVAGSVAMPGAAILATRAAVRAGAGLTTILAPAQIAPQIAAAVPEAVTIPAASTDEGTLSLSAAERVDLDGVQAMAIGPGMGRHPETADAIRTLLARSEGYAVVDADALHALPTASRPAGSATVVTPHEGEWAAMTGKPAHAARSDRLGAAWLLRDQLLAWLGDERACACVLKGPGTVIAGMRDTFIDPIGGSILSQGGSGDVLTGILGAVLAQRAAGIRSRDEQMLEHVVAAGVWVHSRAGQLLADDSPHPSGATRLIGHIPTAIREAQEAAREAQGAVAP